MALLMRPEPFSQEVNRLFNSLFDAREAGPQPWVPAMDLTEAEDHFVLEADLPGLSENDVAIELEDGTLTISGERKAQNEERRRGWHRLERAYGRFSRSLTLPDGVDPDAVAAEFEHGVLRVRIPKPEERKPRRIQIGANGSGLPETLEGSASDK